VHPSSIVVKFNSVDKGFGCFEKAKIRFFLGCAFPCKLKVFSARITRNPFVLWSSQNSEIWFSRFRGASQIEQIAILKSVKNYP